MTTPPPGPPPGWYPDPGNPAMQRWWDGATWGPVQYAYPAPPTGAMPPGPVAPVNQANHAMWAHLGPLLVAAVSIVVSLGLLAFLAFIPPLVIMMGEGRNSPFVRAHAVESLNFQISQLIYGCVAVIAVVIVIVVTFGLGFLLVVPFWIAWLIWSIVVMVRASQAANAGRLYRYPLTIRFVR